MTMMSFKQVLLIVQLMKLARRSQGSETQKKATESGLAVHLLMSFPKFCFNDVRGSLSSEFFRLLSP